MELKQIARIFAAKCSLDPTLRIVIGVSGGADSLCLLDLAFKDGLKIIVGHLNHGLREEAHNEAEMVRKFCQDRSISFAVEQIDIRATAKTQQQSIEEAGRKARYQFLFQLAAAENAQAVAVAHNSDDQVETILMHMLRGSGLPGLRGMDYRQSPNEWSDTIPLVRPLLDFSKAEIIEYCHENNLVPAMDRSNEDRTYYRNRLRLDLVPYLESYNPKIKNRLVSMAEVLRQEDDYLQVEMQSAIEQSVSSSGIGFYIINRLKLGQFHPAIIRRVLYSLMRKLKPSTPNIAFETIDTATRFFQTSSKSGSVSLVADLELCIYQKDSIILDDTHDPLNGLWPQIQNSVQIFPSTAENIQLNGNWRLNITENQVIDRENSWNACFDAEKITDLYLDTCRPGDRFSPLGMQGKSLKLGDYWTNEGLPPRARTSWPLVRSGTEIVWIPGYTINENYKVSNSTRSRISIKVYKE